MQILKAILFTIVSSMELCASGTEDLSAPQEPKIFDLQLFKHLEQAQAHFPMPVNTDTQVSLFTYLMQPDLERFLLAMAPLMKKASAHLIYDMRRNLLGLDVEDIRMIEIIRAFENPRPSYVPITRASCDKTFPTNFNWPPILPSLLLFFKNKGNTLESQAFLDHLVTTPSATQVLTFLFENLESNFALPLLQQLEKTPFETASIWLFFKNVNCPEAQKSFLRSSFFSEEKLRSFKKNLPVLSEKYPLLKFEIEEIKMRYSWLEALPDHGKLVYLEKPVLTRNQKIFGLVMLLNGSYRRWDSFEPALTRLFDLDEPTGIRTVFELAKDPKLDTYWKKEALDFLIQKDFVGKAFDELQRLMRELMLAQPPTAVHHASFSFQLDKIEAIEGVINSLLSKIEETGSAFELHQEESPQEKTESFSTRAKNIFSILTNISPKQRKDAIEKFDLYLNSLKSSIPNAIDAAGKAFPFVPNKAEALLLDLAMNPFIEEATRQKAFSSLVKFDCLEAAAKACLFVLQDLTLSPKMRSNTAHDYIFLARALFPLRQRAGETLLPERALRVSIEEVKASLSILQDLSVSPELRSEIGWKSISSARNLFPSMPDEAEALLLEIAQNPLTEESAQYGAILQLEEFDRLDALVKLSFLMIRAPTTSPYMRSNAIRACSSLAKKLFPLMPDEAESALSSIMENPYINENSRFTAAGLLLDSHRFTAAQAGYFALAQDSTITLRNRFMATFIAGGLELGYYCWGRDLTQSLFSQRLSPLLPDESEDDLLSITQDSSVEPAVRLNNAGRLLISRRFSAAQRGYSAIAQDPTVILSIRLLAGVPTVELYLYNGWQNFRRYFFG